MCAQAATPTLTLPPALTFTVTLTRLQVSGIAGGGDDMLCHTPGRVFGFVDHAGAGAGSGSQPGDGDGDGAARSMFVDGERVPVAPEAAPFVPLLCSNSRLPPALL